MDNLLLIFASSFVVALSGALMPGPVLAVTIAEASRIGLRAGPLIILGHSLLELALFSLLVFGFVHFINRPMVLGVVGLAGGAVLLWMSFRMLRSLRTLDLNVEASGRIKAGPVVSGILLSLANPYWILWWATVGLGYVFWSMQYGWSGMLAFFTGHVSADFAWYTLVSFLVWKGRDRISRSVYRGIVAACAVMLIGFGIYFGVSGLDRLI
jgi:threonine/homoserine/homoserine lactone efflux protein